MSQAVVHALFHEFSIVSSTGQFFSEVSFLPGPVLESER